MMATLLHATEEITKFDTGFQNLVKNEDLILQWKVKNDGPYGYFKFKNGEFEGIRDKEHPQPDIEIVISDSKTAVEVLKGSLEIFEREKNAGNIIIKGNESKIEQLMPILEMISKYMKDLRL